MSDTSLLILTSISRDPGAALTQALMQPGHRLICVARGDNAELYAQATVADVAFDWHQVDLSGMYAAEAWMTRTLAALPALAKVTLVLNAGAVKPISTVDILRADTLLPYLQPGLADPMTLTAILLCDTAPWNAQCCMLTISSGVTRRPVAGQATYCTDKARLDAFMRAVNADGDTSVRAVALVPGVIDTDMQRIVRGAGLAGMQRLRSPHAHGELVSPQDAAARIAAYLIRPDFDATELDDLRNTA